MALRDSLNSWSPRIRSVLRIMSGLLFMAHGIQKHLGFPPADWTPEPFSAPWFAGWIELITGGLIVLGLLTRPAAFLASGAMAAAYFVGHASLEGSGFFPIVNQGELAILYCFIFFYFVFAGPGPWSLDAKLGKDR
ncbi:MAG: DoxX family protein [Rhodospirillaceae bacterium]|nr:DoxX family protein [Rhodospirillaceae bacterium]